MVNVIGVANHFNFRFWPNQGCLHPSSSFLSLESKTRIPLHMVVVLLKATSPCLASASLFSLFACSKLVSWAENQCKKKRSPISYVKMYIWGRLRYYNSKREIKIKAIFNFLILPI